MRFVVLGTGAIGGTVGGRLRQHGHEVVLVARGPQLEAIRARGLTMRDPISTNTVGIDVVAGTRELSWRADDVVLLAVKAHQTAGALTELAANAPSSVSIVCVQNGISNEQEALRRFENVYGCFTGLPATYLTPGVVDSYSTPVTGILDVGRYPHGTDDRGAEISRVFNTATFSSRLVDDVMYWKRRKLVTNLGNAIDAIWGLKAGPDELRERAQQEGEACFHAARLPLASREEDNRRRDGVLLRGAIDGETPKGNSSWQSLTRSAGDIETDYLNGEIVLLGRQHGVPTPVSIALQRVARRMAVAGALPGSLTTDEIFAAAGVRL